MKEIKSTKSKIRDFKESILWEDLTNELDNWIVGLNQEEAYLADTATKNNLSSATVLISLGKISGRKEAISYIKQLPDILLNLLGDVKDDS